MDRDAVNVAVYGCQQASPWRGWVMDKCAQDLLVYQEIIVALRPSIVVETGSWYGGSALFLADMCELVGAGRVLSVDINRPNPAPEHPRLMFLEGDSADPATVQAVHEWAAGETGLVILDSDHSMLHVLAELDAYRDLVRPRGYFVVEDTNVNGHPVRPDFGPGPAEAVNVWLDRTDSFLTDLEIEPFVTFAPAGYLLRVR